MKIIRKIILPLAALTSISYYCYEQPIPTEKITFKTRKQHLQEVINNPSFDVVIIGGGCNGVGVFLDATTRGLRSLIIEKDDFGAGASSKSTKLIHGGVRYLQQVFQFSYASLKSRKQKFNLVKQAIIERSFMIDSAPHLTSKIPFIIPCTNIFTASYYYLGSLVYYLIYKFYAPIGTRIFNPPYFINREDMINIFPKLSSKYTTGIVYEDGSFNDSRMLFSALLTATVGNGIKMPSTFTPGNALNRTQFIDFIKDSSGKITGVIVKDLIQNKEIKIKAKYVINCTGVWADSLRLKDNPNAKKRICPVAGSHITYDHKVASNCFGICAPSPDGRIILVVPWMNRVIAGTTEHKIDQITNNPVCTDEERIFINKTLLDIMGEASVGQFMNCQKARWCGIRPLVADETGDTKNISRSHVIEESASGLISLMGGKWTTYRKMGEDVGELIKKKQSQNGKQLPQVQTKYLPLIGYSTHELKKSLFEEKSDLGCQLYHTFGSLSANVIKGNMKRVFGSTTVAELEWIIKNELVTEIEDVLMRRTRLCFLVSRQQIVELIKIVGDLMQKQWKWSNSVRDVKIKKSYEKIFAYEFD